MTEETTATVSEGTPENKATPQPTFSEQPASPTSALSPEVISALRDALKSDIQEAAERSVQSIKDKRFSALEKAEKGVSSKWLADLEQRGVAIPANLKAEYGLKDYVDSRIAEIQSVTPETGKSMSAPGVGNRGESFNVMEELKQFGLDLNSPEVVKMASGQYRNPDHFRAEAAKLALRTITAKNTPQSDTVSTPPAGAPPAPGNSPEALAAKTAELNRLLRTPTGNQARIDQLQKELGW